MKSKNAPCQPAATAAETASGESTGVTLETRFGTFAFDSAQAIHMSQGLLGFTDCKQFGLVQLPQPGYQQFMLLQSLDDATLTFITLPLSVAGGLIAPQDLVDVCAALEIAADDLAVLLVVSIRKDDDQPEISVNLRAPVFLDVRNKTGRQFVLTNNKYSVRHVLNPDKDAQPPEKDAQPKEAAP